ncbi:MAG: glycosyltransferase family 2 protein [Patiriisocius sp.]
MKNQTKISAVIITLNEQKALPAFLESLWFAHEIIVLDSYSTDNTIAVAKENKKVKVFERTFDDFSSQKNAAISKASHDWIVFFDPDEKITKQLSQEIINTLEDPRAIAYYVKREFYFMGKKIKFSGLQNDHVIRLFNKNYCSYNQNLVHEVMQANGRTATLKNKLPHYSYSSFDNYTAKMHHYSALKAKMLYNKAVQPKLYHFFFRPWWRFVNQYFFKLGILDGKRGFILAYVSAFSVFKRYVNLWLLYRNIK